MMTAYKYIFVFTQLKGFATNAKQLQIEKKSFIRLRVVLKTL